MAQQKRKSLGEEEPPAPEDSWVTTYSDMISLLFAFFALLYGMSKVNEGKFRQVAEALSRSLSTGGLASTVVHKKDSTTNIKEGGIKGNYIMPSQNTKSGNKEKSKKMKAIMKKIQKVLRSQGIKDKVSVHLEERGIVVAMMTDKLRFRIGQADLTHPAKNVINILSPVLKDCKNPLRIEGHTCNIPVSGHFRSNWELSTMRATNVARYLIFSKKINPERVSLLGYGEYNPTYPNNSEANRAKNRRVDIVILDVGNEKLARSSNKTFKNIKKATKK